MMMMIALTLVQVEGEYGGIRREEGAEYGGVVGPGQ